MSRLKISQQTNDALVLRQEFEAGELEGCAWVGITLIVTVVMMVITGHWGWLMVGVIVGITGSNIAAANTPSPGYRLYQFAYSCLTIQECNPSGRVEHEQTILLSQIQAAQVEQKEYRDWKGVIVSEKRVLSLLVGDRTLHLTSEGDTSLEDLATLANAINDFLNPPLLGKGNG
ncbi:MAG: hypothetical protein ACFB0C_14090 [Leptolyngbyaceae cyanobacterium]